MFPSHTPIPPTTPQAAGQHRLRVLVVDDNVDGAEALCDLLTSMGCEISIAFDGAGGLANALEFAPHLAFIDLEMPGMNGCDVARQLRAHAGTSARLVCLTGRGHPDDRRLCKDAGFDAYFTRPMLPQTLVDVIAAAKVRLLCS